jgi:hypothetical protein
LNADDHIAVEDGGINPHWTRVSRRAPSRKTYRDTARELKHAAECLYTSDPLPSGAGTAVTAAKVRLRDWE